MEGAMPRKRILTVASGKGGTGKSVVAVNVGAALALLGRSVLLVDADLGLKNLDLLLGVEQLVTGDLSDLIAGRCRREQAILRHPVIERLAVLPAALCRDKEDVDIDRFVEAVKAVSEEYDYTILDAAHGVGNPLRMALIPAHEVIVVTTPERVPVVKSDKIVGVAEDHGIDHTRIRLVINRVEETLRRDGFQMRADEVLDLLKLPLLAEIPHDYDIFESCVEGRPVVLRAQTAAAGIFLGMARALDGEEVAPHLVPGGAPTLLGKLFGGGA